MPLFLSDSVTVAAPPHLLVSDFKVKLCHSYKMTTLTKWVHGDRVGHSLIRESSAVSEKSCYVEDWKKKKTAETCHGHVTITYQVCITVFFSKFGCSEARRKHSSGPRLCEFWIRFNSRLFWLSDSHSGLCQIIWLLCLWGLWSALRIT